MLGGTRRLQKMNGSEVSIVAGYTESAFSDL